MIELFEAANWQMTSGERAALAGVLAELKPDLAIEIGSAEGGSLACISAHAGEVHSFDLVEPTGASSAPPHVTRHIGDSHQLLPETLRELERRETNVEFVLVDGDHTADGVRQDVEDLLASPAIRHTLILMHDAANEEVRRGLEAVRYGEFPKVKAIDLDFVPGYLVKIPTFHHEVWGGLGLIVVDEGGSPEHRMHLVSNIAYPTTTIFAQYRARVLESVAPEDASANGEGAAARQQARIADLERNLARVTSSKSWRLTAPLRWAAGALRRRST